MIYYTGRTAREGDTPSLDPPPRTCNVQSMSIATCCDSRLPSKVQHPGRGTPPPWILPRLSAGCKQSANSRAYGPMTRSLRSLRSRLRRLLSHSCKTLGPNGPRARYARTASLCSPSVTREELAPLAGALGELQCSTVCIGEETSSSSMLRMPLRGTWEAL